MKKLITVEAVNYFPSRNTYSDWNSKMLYRKYGKLYLCHVYVCFFSRSVYIPRQQPKECTVLKGAQQALELFSEESNFTFNQ